MEVAVHGKQMNVGAPLRSYVQEKIDELNKKFFNHAAFATVTFSKDGHGKKITKVHITLQLGKNILVTADGSDQAAHSAFDDAAAKATKQLRKYKTRLRNHHTRIERAPASEFTDAPYFVLSPDAGKENEDAAEELQNDPIVVAEMTTSIQTLSVSEAVMRLDLSGNCALLFRNGAHGGLNMIYRRNDGNIGWVDPEGQVKAKAPLKTVQKRKSGS